MCMPYWDILTNADDVTYMFYAGLNHLNCKGIPQTIFIRRQEPFPANLKSAISRWHVRQGFWVTVSSL